MKPPTCQKGFMMRKPIVLALLLMVLITTVVFSTSHSSQITWTDHEKAFIESHPLIVIGVDPKFEPFEFINDAGNYQGIAADYLALISEKTGLKFQIKEGLSWPEAYDQAVLGQIDMLPAVHLTKEREQYFLFSDAYYNNKRVLVFNETESSIRSFEDLDGLTVATQRNSSHHSYLMAYPGIDLSLYETVEEALSAVADGSEQVFVGNLTVTQFIIRSNALTGLKLVTFEAEKKQTLHMAVRKDWPILVTILNKALDDIHKKTEPVYKKNGLGLRLIPILVPYSGFWV